LLVVILSPAIQFITRRDRARVLGSGDNLLRQERVGRKKFHVRIAVPNTSVPIPGVPVAIGTTAESITYGLFPPTLHPVVAEDGARVLVSDGDALDGEDRSAVCAVHGAEVASAVGAS
jgi:hypothetical protein